jgi:hypothetical protein
MWLMSHLVYFTLPEHATLDMQDYIDSCGSHGGERTGGVNEGKIKGFTLWVGMGSGNEIFRLRRQ